MKRLSFIVTVCLCLAQLPLMAASPVVISEFMANNTRTLFDEDGDSEDWIEIHNISANEVNLLNWSLTDDDDELDQWRFPSTNIAAGAYMVIFASNKDRKTPGRPLHTNFRLNEDGDYLALVDPNGIIASSFGTRFPAQVPNVSYGIGLISSNSTILNAGAALKVLVPTPGNGGSTLGDTWKGTNEPFADGGWRAGLSGVGFSSPAAPSLVATSALTVRLNFDAAPVGNVIVDSKPIGAAINGTNNTAYWQASSTDSSPTPIARSGVMQFIASSNSQVTLPANAAFNTAQGSVSFWMRSFGFFGPGQGPAVIMARYAIAANLATGVLLQQNADGRLQWLASSNGVVGSSLTTTASPSDDRWHHIAVVYNQNAGGSVSIYIDGVLNATAVNSSGWAWPTAQHIELGRNPNTFRNYHGTLDDFRVYNRVLSGPEVADIQDGDGGIPSSEIGVDVLGEMLNINSSAFIRVPFTVANTGAFSTLTLRMRHNDGFAAWINGQPVGTVNAPNPVVWDSAATEARSSSLADSITISDPASLLRNGGNILAIQGLNVSANDPTFLILPELLGTSVPVESTNGFYFTQPTPGADNTGGSTNIGPTISEIAHIPNVPIDSEDLRVSARLIPTFNLISNATLRYRIMFGNEVSVPMNDGGTNGDLVAGDGLWSAPIPESASTNGQMIRYYITAQDVRGNASKWPLFYNPTNSEQYLGTIVEPTGLTSKLPIYHLFINPTEQGLADGENGTWCSVFYDGEFYDHVRIELRGNTSASFKKKAHRLEFNRDHRFRHLPGYPRVGDTSLLGESADPAYLRQMFSFWLTESLGVPSPFDYPVRVQLNTAFYQLSFHSDVMGSEHLERLGYDPNGALYKAVGQVRPTFDSTGGFEKKTRLFEDRSDYLALANGIAEGVNAATRATNVFDMMDVPNVINYLAAARWTQEADDVWANMTLYRDTLGDELWRIIPFDMNVSWGQLYCGDNPGAFNTVLGTNDNFKSHPLYGGSSVLVNGGGNWNRIYDVIIRTPETREMLLRRMRSMLDEFIEPPSGHPLSFKMEQRVLDFTNSIYNEAILDRLRWGWENSTVGAPAAGPYCYGTNQWVTNHTPEIMTKFIAARRQHWYGTHSITNTARAIGISNIHNAGIPLSQPTNAAVQILSLDYNPSSGNQEEEFLCITNSNPYAVDISGWKLGGGVEFTFKGGTIIGSNKVLYVSPNLKAFRNRSVAPRGGMALHVVGPYQGQLSARGEPLTITDHMGRLVYTNFHAGNPSVAQQFLRVTELMYNPNALVGNTNDAQEFEYVELKNISGGTTINLTGVKFVNGIQFDFSGSAVTSLAAGQRAVIVRNSAAFTARYGGAATIAGQYTGALDNAGERLQLLDASNEEILDFSYNNSWYPITDGLGFSLVVSNELSNTGLWDQKAGWRPSGTLNGAPGQPDPATPVFANIVVSEVLAHTDPPLVDAIELHNPTPSDVNIGGWFLSDDFDVPRKYRITNGCVIPAGGYLSFGANLFGASATAIVPFSLSSTGDDVWLFSGDANTNLTGYLFGEDFGASFNGVSLGRYTNSVGQVNFVAQTARTLGAPNSGPRVGPVVISEIMYHPPDLSGGRDNADDEYVELRNITGAPVDFFNTPAAGVGGSWRLRGGVDYQFPAYTLPANGRVLVVSFNTNEVRRMAAFRTKFNVPPSVPVFGPFSGQLDNSSDDLRLEAPDTPEPSGVPYVRIDRVEYSDETPWPVAADGTGASLQRINLSAYGNDPANWTAGTPSAGTDSGGGTAPSVVTQPVDRIGVVSGSATFSVSASGTGPLNYQWLFNDEPFEAANSPILTLNNLRFDQAGKYSVLVYNNSGSTVSSNATLTLQLPVYITSNPTNVTLRGSTNSDSYGFTTNNATFRVSAVAQGAFNYQWRFNGVPIPGETSSTLTVVGVGLTNDGFYDVVVSDPISTAISAPARLAVLLTPILVSKPANVSVITGQTFSVSAAVTGNPFPMEFDWRQGSTPLGTNIVYAHSNFVTFRAPSTIVVNQGWRVVVRNAAYVGTVVNHQFFVTTLLDTDADGIPDDWENSYQFNPGSDADRNLDSDGDLMSNWAEYIAGTNPTNAASFLRVQASLTGTGSLVSFSAVSNKTYSVEFTDDLTTGAWGKLTDVISRTTDHLVTVPDEGFNTNRFYRVVTPYRP